MNLFILQMGNGGLEEKQSKLTLISQGKWTLNSGEWVKADPEAVVSAEAGVGGSGVSTMKACLGRWEAPG